LSSSVTFSPVTKMEINDGGILKPNAFTFTYNSGAFYCYSGGTVLAGGLFRTQNTVTLNIRTGSAFNSALNVNTGTTTAGEFSSPYNGRFYGNLTIENGATLSTNPTALLMILNFMEQLQITDSYQAADILFFADQHL
jgi:hypothetical protein